MIRSFTGRKRFRKSFGKFGTTFPLPNLIDLQKKSFDSFLQYGVPPNEMENIGLLKIFNSTFPVTDGSNRAQLEFLGFDYDKPLFSETECKQHSGTYSVGIKGKFRLVIWDMDEEIGVRSIKDIKEQEVYLGEVPLMTDKGTFIFNGIERVVVSQMHRSPGVFFGHDGGKSHVTGKILYSARVIPYRGSWIDFEFDHRDLLFVRFDRRRKCSLATFLMCLYSNETEEYIKEFNCKGKIDPYYVSGMSKEEILGTFYETIKYKKLKKNWSIPFVFSQFKGTKLSSDLINAETNEVVAKAGDRINARVIHQLEQSGLKYIIVPHDYIHGKILAKEVINESTGEVYAEAGEEITESLLKRIAHVNPSEVDVLDVENAEIGKYVLNSMGMAKTINRDEALCEFYRNLIPGEVPTPSMGEELLRNTLWNPDRYDLSIVGRAKLNNRLGIDFPDDTGTLQKKDIIEIIRLLCLVKNGKSPIDDIDNLGNRRVRSVGELIENQCRSGMLKMERGILEKMTASDLDSYVPSDFISAKALMSSIKDFFVSSTLSQFMDQTNPLSEVTHKRRLSALGQGGLSRERAGFEVRDVHPTHYSRLCPIETPEGQNIGLITSLASYARINQYGFIEAPYQKVVDCKLTGEIDYLTSDAESKCVIAQANVNKDKDGNIIDELVICRKAGDIGYHPKTEVNYADISPQQTVSVSAALIPFVETDDATRALMGSNMQRQAVPLLMPEAPLVGTGMELVVAQDAGSSIVAKRAGIVDRVDSRRIVIRVTGEDAAADTYPLLKFQCSNMNTCINQRPLVKLGDVVEAGDIIADGAAIETGELALGRNLLVAFLSWKGYSIDDSIVLSERLVKDDVLTSIHIESFEVTARDTKLGNEEITRDIPNLAEESLKNLDESGIVYVGAEVNPGDILVGKVTPKGESMMTPEEKLLRAIFGEKSSDVKDSSFRVPPGISGTVVEVRVMMRRGVEKDERTIAIDRQRIEELTNDRDAEIDILESTYAATLREKFEGHKVITGPNKFLNIVLSKEDLKEMSLGILRQIEIDEDNDRIKNLLKQLDTKVREIRTRFEESVAKLRRGSELPAGVLKHIKVFVAQKRKIQCGDKMAGRHGNKGVVSKILPVEDMPYLEDGTPVDIVLNPLGLPSRMNLGQILETHLGAAAHALGKQIQEALDEYRKNHIELKDVRDKVIDCYEDEKDVDDIKKLNDNEFIELAEHLRNGIPMATPVFDGAKLSDIEHYLKKAGLDASGQVTLYDGQTGSPFDRKVTVGYKYMLKLHHLVDDKIHARSVGPYSLITQQPLGGKAQFGGQRFGEMEVWALEAYGAAYILLEMLTIKSDDIMGRSRAYSNIVKGDNGAMANGYPESWHVLTKELNALGLNLTFEEGVLENTHYSIIKPHALEFNNKSVSDQTNDLDINTDSTNSDLNSNLSSDSTDGKSQNLSVIDY